MERALSVHVRCAAAPASVPPQRPSVKLGGRYFTTGNGNSGGFVFPEKQPPKSEFSVPGLLDKPNFGVALSGGGFRAANLAAGWIEGLKENKDVWDNIRYLSSNSGGSWFNCAFSFRNQRDLGSHTNFLEPYVPPSSLTLDQIKKTPQSKFLGLINKNRLSQVFIHESIDEIASWADSNVTSWSYVIGETFLKPFGLGNVSSTVADSTTLAFSRVKDEVESVNPKPDVYVAAAGPYPLVVGSAYLLEDPVNQFYPVEFAPLSAGTPSFHTFTYTDGFWFWKKEHTIKLGGGLVEPFLVDSGVPDHKLPDSPNGSQVVKGPGGTLVPLTLMAGISSAFFGAGVFEVANKLASNKENKDEPNAHKVTKMDYVAFLNKQVKAKLSNENPIEKFLGLTKVGRATTEDLLAFGFPEPSPAVPSAPTFQYVDGGVNDNLALFPHLRRGVEHVVLLVACTTPIVTQGAGSGKVPDIDATATSYNDIARVFGALPPGSTNGVDNDVLNRNSQVFAMSEWKTLVQDMYANVSSGKPAAVRRTYTTIENPFQFVKGGWKVDVLWVWNQQCGEWESQLPQETKNDLAAARAKVQAAGKGPSVAPSAITPAGPASDWLGDFVQDWLSVKEFWGSEGSFNYFKHYFAFPYISTLTTQIYPKPANMLYQQAAWTTKVALATEIEDMIAAAKR